MMVISFCGRRLIQKQNNLFKIPKRNGYIVLVPEIGEDLPQKNPLLKEDNLPEFNNITIEKCIAAIGKQTLEFEERVNAIETNLEKNSNADVFNDALHPIEESYIPLEITWGVAKTLFFGNQSLMPTKCYFSIHERAKKAYAYKYTRKSIYEACKKSKNNKELDLSQQQSRVLSKYILEGKLNGLELNAKNTKFLNTVMRELHQKITDYKDKLEWAMKQFSYTIRDKGVMREFPESYLKTIAADPTQPYEGPWTINLQPYIARPFLEYCPDRHLRWKVWENDVLRGSTFNEKLLSTSIPLEEIRASRKEQAKTLGFASYAEMSMETKMAKSLDNLYHVFDTLLETAYPAQEKEIQLMSEFAIENGSEGNILPWDVAYWNRKQIQTLYKYDEEVIKNYFPLPKVLTGIFQLLTDLFSIRIVENTKVDVWHEDVRCFDIFDLKKTDSEPVASFYLDPYARTDEKVRFQQDAGWMVPIKNKSKICDTKPLAALIFNFSPPMFGKPSLLTFKEVKMLFQKFGHLLQNLLTTVEYAEISGLSFVEWDAAHISDFFMENWLYEPSTLEMISSHYDTNETLPTEMINNLNLVKTHLAGYNLCRELYLSRMDLELYSSDKFWQVIMNNLWKKHFVIPQQKKDCHVCSFDTIFSGDWGAAYYSQLWSELVAADAFSAFKEIPSSQRNNDKLKEIGNRYRETFLSLGGSYPANEIFRRFRGRDPSAEALLESLDLKKYAQKSLTE